MHKLAFLFVALAFVAVSFYGCDAGPSEPDPSAESTVDDEQVGSFKWYLYDSDFNSISETIYLECLDETVLLEGDVLWWIWNGDFEDIKFKNGFWLAPWTTMVGPSGTWTILRQAGPEPGKWGVKHDVGQVAWENAGTRATLRTYPASIVSPVGSECRLTGPK